MVRKRYALRRMEGRGDRECSRNETTPMQSADRHDVAEEEMKKALNCRALTLLSMSRDS